jgi:hypothetical protein
MRTSLMASTALGIVVTAASVGFSQGKPSAPLSVEGVWKRTSTVVTGANPSSNTDPQPSVYIYAKKHYSHIFQNNTTIRKPLPAPKDPNNVTNAEKIAAYEAWQPLGAHSGTYEIKGTTIVHHYLVNKNPPPVSGVYPEANVTFENVRIEGNTIVRTAKSADGKSVTTWTYTRLE